MNAPPGRAGIAASRKQARHVLRLVAEQSPAVQLFVNPFPAIHGTFLDTRTNLAKNLTILRHVRGGTGLPGYAEVRVRVFSDRVTLER